MAGMELVFELWVDDGDVDLLGEEYQAQEEEELHDADLHSDDTVRHAVASGPASATRDEASQWQVPKAREQHERLLKAYRGESGAGWFPHAPKSLPRMAPAPLWVEAATPLEWFAGPTGPQRKQLTGTSSASPAAKQQQQLTGARSEGLDVQQALDAVPTMATITSVSPACIFLPAGVANASVSLAVSGTHLTDAGCQLLGRSKTACSHELQVNQVVRKSATVQVTVHQVSSPTCLLLEARMNHLVSQSRAVLVVDDVDMAHELVQPQHTSSSRSITAAGEPSANDALIRDLGTWLEYCHERRAELVGSMEHQSNTQRQQKRLTAAVVHEDEAPPEEGVTSALVNIDALLGAENSLQKRQGNDVAALKHSQTLRKTMTSLGVHLLGHAVGAGWCAVSTRIVHELMEVQGLCLDTIFRLASSGGLPLLHRAICSSQIQMLHTVLRWSDANEHEWDLEHLVPTRSRRGSTVHVSALHLAAAMGDQGYAAELLLVKYAKARRLWNNLRDSRGLLPCQYAAVAGNQHLDCLADNALLDAPERPLGPGDEGEALQASPRSDDLPKIASLQQLAVHTKGRRVPRTPAAPAISVIGRFLEQASQEALPPPPASPVTPPECDGEMEARWQLLGDEDAADSVPTMVGGAADRVSKRVECQTGEGYADEVPFARPELRSWATEASSTMAHLGDRGLPSPLELRRQRSPPLPEAPSACSSGETSASAGPKCVSVASSVQAADSHRRYLESHWLVLVVLVAWVALHLPLLPMLMSPRAPGTEGNALAQMLMLVLVELALAVFALRGHWPNTRAE